MGMARHALIMARANPAARIGPSVSATPRPIQGNSGKPVRIVTTAPSEVRASTSRAAARARGSPTNRRASAWRAGIAPRRGRSRLVRPSMVSAAVTIELGVGVSRGRPGRRPAGADLVERPDGSGRTLLGPSWSRRIEERTARKADTADRKAAAVDHGRGDCGPADPERQPGAGDALGPRSGTAPVLHQIDAPPRSGDRASTPRPASAVTGHACQRIASVAMVGVRRAHDLHVSPGLFSLPALETDQSGRRCLSPDRGLLPVRRPGQGRVGLLVAALFLAARPLARRG